MDKRVWLSRRALKLHAVILVVVPAFLALCVWQIHRALGGNSLSWAYVFEWPLFAGYAVYMWWRFVHEAAEDAAGRAAGVRPPVPRRHHGAAPAARRHEAHPATDARRGAQEDAELAAYNEYLAQLAEQDKAAGR